jgi:hypothetical protein
VLASGYSLLHENRAYVGLFASARKSCLFVAVSWLVFFIAKNGVFFCKKALFHLVSRRFRAWFPACFLAVSGAEFYLFPSCFSLRSFQNSAF